MKIIGEVGQAHDGSLGTAHAFIDAIADSGADAVKFQTHIASAESSAHEPWRVPFGYQDETRYEYWKRMEFTAEQWRGLKDHADERGLIFLSSPFSVEAVELLSSLDLALWKIPSGEVNNPFILEAILETQRPVLLSSGMSTWADLDPVVARIQQAGAELTLFQCTTRYPTPPEELGLNLMAEFRERYQCQVGLSDHSGTIYAGLAASVLGADWLEVHVTLSPRAFGPDVSSSLTTEEMGQLVRGVRWLERVAGNPADKASLGEDVSQMRSTFGQSLVASRDLAAGEALSREDVACRKPGTGIPVRHFERYLGRKMARVVAAGQFLAEADFSSSD